MDPGTVKDIVPVHAGEKAGENPVTVKDIVPVHAFEKARKKDFRSNLHTDNIQIKDTKELRVVSEYSGVKERDMKNRYKECKDMGFFSSLMDSKFPGIDNVFLNFFCLTTSDKDAILKLIKAYEKVYKRISKFAQEKRKSKQVDYIQLRVETQLLKEKLKQLTESARLGESETWSKAMQQVHKSFIEEHHKLDSIVTDLERAASEELAKVTQNRCNEALKSLAVLSEECRDVVTTHKDLSNKYAEISNKYIDVRQKFELVQGEALAKQEILIAQNKSLEEKVDRETEEASASRDAFITQIKLLEKKMDNEEKEASAKQDVLIAQNKNLEEKVDLLQKEREEASADRKNLEKKLNAMMEKLEQLTART